MGIKRIHIISLFILVFGALTIQAQDWPVVTEGGKEYYIHEVAPGNTLYAISKKYSVSISDLISANPNAEAGLSIGTRVRIPVEAVNRKKLKKQEVSMDGDELLHTVQKKETLFSISRKYGIGLNELTEANPEAVNSLRTGLVLKIPVAKSTQTDAAFLAPAASDTFLVHQVQPGDTPYSLAKYYEISLDSLSDANKGFPDGLRTGSWISVPKYTESFLAKQEELQVEAPENSLYSLDVKASYKFGFMLPFEVMVNDSLEKSLRQGKDLYMLTEIALEYYRGAKLAMDSLKKRGLNAEVYVYDVGDDLVGVRDVIRRPEMNEMDVIFGPMHKASLAAVSEVSREKGIYLVSPNSFSNEIFEDNPYLLRASASRETLMRYLANYVAINHQDNHVLMVNSESPKDYNYVQLFSSSYASASGTFPNSFRDTLKSITKENLDPEEIGKFLRTDTLNVLVVPSNDLAFVSDFITRLARSSGEEYPVQIYGLDNWIRYDNIDASYKNKFKLRLVVPTFVDYSEEDVVDFISDFRAKYEMEPSYFDYGFQAYDLAMYMGEALLKYGKGFPNYLDVFEWEGLTGTFRFGKSTTGSEIENKSVAIIEYDNFEIKRKN